ncbi:beta-1,6-N-acetylglucosaminyltransferase [Winogradskyella maritima]|uniref:Peptide O-xylosyltransferase n=1 Tax=Winogradskyella maritima TaxID=1517766 RepID=A0ABV8AK77_9FLAO|nr:beta-1,6-N-acetylglucosaminyltransferase [Winogradskyella maritima]
MQALLITAYKNFEHLYELASVFDEQMHVYIHIDKRSFIPKKMLAKLRELPQIKLISQKFKVFWGGFSHLRAILYLVREAQCNKEIVRFHLISGHDYPIKTFKEFDEFFRDNSATNYILNYKLPIAQWPNGGMERYEYYNLYDVIDAKKKRQYIFKAIEFQKRLGIKRSMRYFNKPIYGGDTWWSLNREAVDYIIHFTRENPKFFSRHRHTFCSEEIYFQTILCNSYLSDSLQNNSLRYIDWSDRNGNFPANLDSSDFKHLIHSEHFFARKFEVPISADLKETIKNELFSN